MAIFNPISDNNKRKMWSELSEDITVVVKRIETLEHKRIILNTMQTVGDLKLMIKGWWGDEPDEQKLIIGTEVLVDDIVLGMYGISDKSIIHLAWRRSVRSCRLNRMIIKNRLSSSCFVVMWCATDKVDFIIDRVADKTTAPKDMVSLFHNDVRLNPQCSISSYRITHDTTVRMEIGGCANSKLPVGHVDVGSLEFAYPAAGSMEFAKPKQLEQVPPPRDTERCDHGNEASTVSSNGSC